MRARIDKIVLLAAIRIRMIYYANIHSGANMTIQTMLLYLFNFGMSQTEIASAGGSTQPTISRAAKGSA